MQIYKYRNCWLRVEMVEDAPGVNCTATLLPVAKHCFLPFIWKAVFYIYLIFIPPEFNTQIVNFVKNYMRKCHVIV